MIIEAWLVMELVRYLELGLDRGEGHFPQSQVVTATGLQSASDMKGKMRIFVLKMARLGHKLPFYLSGV